MLSLIGYFTYKWGASKYASAFSGKKNKSKINTSTNPVQGSTGGKSSSALLNKDWIPEHHLKIEGNKSTSSSINLSAIASASDAEARESDHQVMAKKKVSKK